MATAASAPPITAEDLQAQLASAREKTSAAEVRLGEAVLDEQPTDKLQKEYDAALVAEQQIAAAISLAKRRDADAAVAAEEDAERAERIAVYSSAAEWLPLVESYCQARQALDALESELEANNPHPTITALKRHFITAADDRVADLDDRFLRELPKPPTLDAEHKRVVFPDPGNYPPDRIAALIARANELAEAEERGESIAVTHAERQAQHRAERQAKRKERRR